MQPRKTNAEVQAGVEARLTGGRRPPGGVCQLRKVRWARFISTVVAFKRTQVNNFISLIVRNPKRKKLENYIQKTSIEKQKKGLV